jgi:hypothetical protein
MACASITQVKATGAHGMKSIRPDEIALYWKKNQ